MKKLLSISAFCLAAMAAQAQVYPFVSITDLNTNINLANCNDTSIFYGDTVRTVGVVVVDGNLSEVPSGSVTGGYRPFIQLVDTANGGVVDSAKGIELQGIIPDGQGGFQVYQAVTNSFAGDIVEVIGYVNNFGNNTQINTLNASSFTILGSQSAPQPLVLNDLSELNDQNRVNQLQTGEEYENLFVEIKDLTVVQVIPFGNGRVSFDVADNQGNLMNVSDRFLAQKTASHQTVNANSPATTGSFVAPVPGTFYNSISGIIRHSGNGCLGNGRGFEINPFDSTHYNIGFAPPFIDDVERDPLIPTPNQSVDITATITDFDGTVDSVAIAYSTNPSALSSTWPVFPMTLSTGSTDEYEYSIPNQPDGTQVRYYIYAEDDAGNPSYFPSTPSSQAEPNFAVYTVRASGILSIQDVQQPIGGSGDSPYRGQTVTLRGYVTAAARDEDLGYVYIQDATATEYAGISLISNPDLQNLYRNEFVEVTGEIQENFGFTQMVVSSVSGLGGTDTIQPIALDLSDSAALANDDWEKYEGMLVKYENPTAGGQIFITDENAGFGDYMVGTDPTFGFSKSARVLAGRQSNSANSSLWVQLVSEARYDTIDGFMNVSPIVTADTMSFDAIVGVLSYGFSNYRLLPRANDDIIGANFTLNPTGTRPNNVSIEELSLAGKVAFYPNPASSVLNVKTENGEAFSVQIFDLNGKMILNGDSELGEVISLDVEGLPRGVFILKTLNDRGQILATGKVIKK